MPGQIDYSKFKIIPDPDTAEWWAATRERRLLVRLCKGCGHKWFPPSPACAKCMSMELDWYETTGSGVIHSYTVVEQAVLGAFVEAVPYTVVLVELDGCHEADGSLTRIAGVLLDGEETVAIGLPVTVEFEETPDPEIVMPRWKISGSAADAWRFDE
jgi:uncharacterized OB-fold protein